MITVADILALPAIYEWELLTEVPNALGRRVVNIGVFDAMPDESEYDDYLPGEFIISNMGFARESQRDAEHALCTILARNVAAVAIRNVYDIRITDKIRAASLRSGTPLFVYQGEYYEQVIFQAMKLIERDAQDSDIAVFVDEVLRRRTSEEVSASLYQAFGSTGATVQCAQVRPLQTDEISLYAQIDELKAVTASIKKDWERIETAKVLRYHDSALVVVTYNRPPEAFSLHFDSEFIDLLKPYARVRSGISEELPIGQGDIALRQAIAALDLATESDKPIVRWASMLDLTLEVAARRDRMYFDTATLYQRILERYDEANGTTLAATAAALARTCGDVKQAAEMLFQHQNTVRYRMRKMKELFNMANATDRELIRFLVLVYLV